MNTFKKYLFIVAGALTLQGCVGTIVLNRGEGEVGDPLAGPSLHSVPPKPKPTPLKSRDDIEKALVKDMQEAQKRIKNHPTK